MGMKVMNAVAVVLVLGVTDCLAETSPAKQITAKIVCGRHTASPQGAPAFQNNLIFDLAQGVLTMERETKEKPGKEVFRGIISPLGAVLIIGEGSYVSGSAWVYEFQGRLDDKGHATLKGTLKNTIGPVGGRECTIAI
jgi:hypothetical protein